MRTIRMLALAVSTVLAAGLVVISPASAATSTIDVNCVAGDTDYLTVAPGDQITFTLDSTCKGLLENIATISSSQDLLGVVSQLADLSGTGGSLDAIYAAVDPWLVTYTAGQRSGTDSLVLQGLPLDAGLRHLAYRLPGGATYYMTVPGGGAAPAPWFQAVGRTPGAECPAGWSPSWGQWMNGGAGGFTCVREQYYDTSTGMWGYRKQ